MLARAVQFLTGSSKLQYNNKSLISSTSQNINDRTVFGSELYVTLIYLFFLYNKYKMVDFLTLKLIINMSID